MTATTTTPARAGQPLMGRRFLLTRVLALLIGLTVVVVLVILLLLRSTPGHWKQNQRFLTRASTSELFSIAEAVQQRVANALFELDSGRSDRVSVRVTTREANAWLFTRLPAWLAHQNIRPPPALADPMIAIVNRQLVLAFELRTEQVKQVVSVTADARVPAAGWATVELKSIKAGRLSLPLQTLLDQLRGHVGGAVSAEDWQRLVAHCAGEPIRARWRSNGGRSCQLAGLVVADDAVELTFTADKP